MPDELELLEEELLLELFELELLELELELELEFELELDELELPVSGLPLELLLPPHAAKAAAKTSDTLAFFRPRPTSLTSASRVLRLPFLCL